jgi:hypothetical protein
MNQEQIENCIAACAASARECREFCESYRFRAELIMYIVNCRDCAELCEICIHGLERRSRVARALCLACAAACELCVEAFRIDATDPFRRYREACRRCAIECRKLTG